MNTNRIKAEMKLGLKRMFGSIGLALVKDRPLQDRKLSDAQQLAYAVARLEGLEVDEGPEFHKRLSELIGTTVAEGLYIAHYLRRAQQYSGDVCEFGVAQGATSALLAHGLRSSGRRLWLYDSFEGLPAPTAEDELIDDVAHVGSMDAYAGRMAWPESSVIGRFTKLGFPANQYKIVKGYFTNSADTPGPESVCFAYIDFDFYEPILHALRFSDDRMNPGGIIVVDDYGYLSSGAAKAVDEFVAEKSPTYEITVPPSAYGRFCILQKRGSVVN